ncbi:FadR/GntR family transcriptional regulator [Pleomorphomonas carboxyditropha]|uniref:Pyruvate dehydrogenase complex repressor n=1 Tax=Pleomorphomonas carboxyditropha TaxID=2023338 RepID=A0A2G9WVW9_9HYPH|nr:FadR/GntR family transcriptional regulator [Pleomorphomonas carboxyditropha]PIO98851.1 GntR family transcriptional regulator [Pleomorphomonas carboxyditropha]
MTNPNARRRTTLSDSVYHSLFGRISNGEYRVNEKLPPETVLSQEFGVSRPVLRMALERLREEGLIHSRQGAGSYVRTATASTPVGFSPVETLADIQRCYEFRLTIETQAAALAADRRDETALRGIAQALELMRAATGSHQHREDADFAFHLAIAQASNNQYFEATFRALREHINVGMRLHGMSLMAGGGLEETLAEHNGLFDAISAGDRAQASELMRGHLEHSRDRLFGGGLLDLRMSRQPPA